MNNQYDTSHTIDEVLGQEATVSLTEEDFFLLTTGEDLQAEEELDFSEGC